MSRRLQHLDCYKHYGNSTKEKFHDIPVGLRRTWRILCRGRSIGYVSQFYLPRIRKHADIHAGTSGFLAGAILISGGVIALTLLSTHAHQTDAPLEKLKMQ